MMPNESNKRALLIGIDDYRHFARLGGCVNDVRALQPLLADHEDMESNFDCVVRDSGRDVVDRSTVLEALDQLLAPGADAALFYFAGHGMQAANDVVLVTQETQTHNDGVALSAVLGKVQSSAVPLVILILDCCFSGGAGGAPQLGHNAAVLRDGVTILTASRADQPAEESLAGRGLFSSLLCGALDGGAADVLGRVTLAGLYAYLAESFSSWQQKPSFKANLQRLPTLRTCKPALSRAQLRALLELFKTPTEEYSLDRTYEKTCLEHTPENVAKFELLQRGRAARIVEPIGTDHMYDAAMQHGSCRLTPLGRHYWVVFKKNRSQSFGLPDA